MYMKKLLIVLAVLLFCSFTFAGNQTVYKHYIYGHDFNLSEFVIDANGIIDSGFHSDCNVIINQQSTNNTLVNNLPMLHDATTAGLYYYPVPATNYNTWSAGYYNAIMQCIDGNAYGSKDVSFIIETSSQIIYSDQYLQKPYSQDFNLGDFVFLPNGTVDSGFTSDCNLTTTRQSDGLQTFVNTSMLHDAVSAGKYFLNIPASNTTVWPKGFYTAIMECENAGLHGSQDLSFVLVSGPNDDILKAINDTNNYLGGLIMDINVTGGGGLNSDQNKILYDLNKYVVQQAIDTSPPIITITTPEINSTISSSMISFTVSDKSHVPTIQVLINGVASSVFNSSSHCVNNTCTYFETALNINTYNDVNVIAIDDYGNIGRAYSTFLYSSTRPRTSFGSGPSGVDTSISVLPTELKIEYEKGEKINKTISIKNNTTYDLFLSFSPSTELAGKIFMSTETRLLKANETKDFSLYVLNNNGSVSGNLVVSSQFSSVNVPVDLSEKPFNFMPILLFIIIIVGAYLFFMRR